MDLKNNETVEANIYNYSKKEFKKEKFLYHFTHFDTLKLIFDGMKLQLSQINEHDLNDEMEIKTLNPFYRHKVYICCFTNSISEYFWENYTKASINGHTKRLIKGTTTIVGDFNTSLTSVDRSSRRKIISENRP